MASVAAAALPLLLLVVAVVVVAGAALLLLLGLPSLLRFFGQASCCLPSPRSGC